MFIRKAVFAAMALILTLSLTGCMGAGDEAEVTAAPTQLPVVTAEATGIPGDGNSAFDWNSEAESVESAIEQLSEVENARVAISGNTALVGVKFDAAYKGEMTERIREMIAGVVKKADPSIKVVAVTAEENDVNSIFGIADRVRAGAGEVYEDFKDDIETIVRNATTMR